MRAISKGLPRQPKQDGHFAAMPYDRGARFILKLRARESFSCLALEFAILTASRSGECARRPRTSSIWSFVCGRFRPTDEGEPRACRAAVGPSDGDRQALRRTEKAEKRAGLLRWPAAVRQYSPASSAGDEAALHAARVPLGVSDWVSEERPLSVRHP